MGQFRPPAVLQALKKTCGIRQNMRKWYQV